MLEVRRKGFSDSILALTTIRERLYLVVLFQLAKNVEIIAILIIFSHAMNWIVKLSLE